MLLHAVIQLLYMLWADFMLDSLTVILY